MKKLLVMATLVSTLVMGTVASAAGEIRRNSDGQSFSKAWSKTVYTNTYTLTYGYNTSWWNEISVSGFHVYGHTVKVADSHARAEKYGAPSKTVKQEILRRGGRAYYTMVWQ